MYKKGEISGLYSDMGRIISYDVAGHVVKENAIKGVGSGDMMTEMKQGYEKWYPQITDEQVLLPHNQFLVMLLAGGVPALLFFVAWVFYPLKDIRRNRASFYLVIVWIALLLPLMIEPMLEVQFGVFVYLFFLLWQWHALRNQDSNAEIQKV
jgi:O-antigen ligase